VEVSAAGSEIEITAGHQAIRLERDRAAKVWVKTLVGQRHSLPHVN
jgi:hypothetical protein